jgi:hypothetical protein
LTFWPYPKNPSDGYKVLKGGAPQKIDPHQKSDFKQMTLWIKYIQKLTRLLPNLTMGNTTDVLKQTETTYLCEHLESPSV